jgi:copper(I)-binding protein
MRRATTLAMALLIGAAAAGCGGSDPVTGVTVTDAWARASAPGQTLGVVYLTLEASPADTLVSVSVPSSVAGQAALHETVPDTQASGDDMGAMTMREMNDGLTLADATPVSLAPGGQHVMLVDLVEPLVTGDTFDLTLEFEHAAPQTVAVVVAETAP